MTLHLLDPASLAQVWAGLSLAGLALTGWMVGRALSEPDGCDGGDAPARREEATFPLGPATMHGA